MLYYDPDYCTFISVSLLGGTSAKLQRNVPENPVTLRPAYNNNDDDELAKSSTSALPTIMCLDLVTNGAQPGLIHAQSPIHKTK